MKLGERLLLVKSWSRPLQRQRRRLFSQTSAGIAEADDIKDALGMSTEACQRLLEEGGFEQYRSLQAYQFLHHTSMSVPLKRDRSSLILQRGRGGLMRSGFLGD